ncbi:response regulator [Croceivirga thetidis]|uniref:Response regulator transcription factor n=1 Tax=Croceivirga thetidis TaxID=2721623 RepID=A0ABX1GRX0_9FLAO|nr:response regulator transcription factor [Croceivirga thetidis]NKI32692.1 response regulator transcription factor [Croceivirga thetidis]
MITVGILDDHQMILEGLATMLSEFNDIEVAGSWSNPVLCEEDLKTEQPNVLLLDINLKTANGIELCSEWSKSYPEMKIIAVSNYNESGFIKNMLRNGAKSYLLKNTNKNELAETIRLVDKGNQYLPRAIETILLQDSLGTPKPKGSIPKLTRREKEILQHISEEFTNAEIANKLFVSIKTVESHRTNLLSKFGVKNTAGLIKAAMNAGLIS